MSFLSRVFGRRPAPEAPAPPDNTVVIEADVAALLVAGGAPLGRAVNDALHEYIEAKAKAEVSAEARGIPFWLRRDSERAGEIEDELRDRVIGRRSTEEGGG